MLFQNISDIYGERAFFDLIELMLMGITVAFIFYYGSQFLRRSRDKDAYEVEKKLNIGYAMFFLSLALGYGAYVMDRVWRFIWGHRLFKADYTYDTAFSSDYFIFIFSGLSIGIAVLTYVVEKYILSRKTPVVPIISMIGLIITIFIRQIEQMLLPISADVAAYIGYFAYGITLIVFIMLWVIYVKIAKAAPKGSDLWNRSVSFLIGITLMVVMLAGGNNQFSKADDFLGEGWIGPFITLASLFILQYGLSKAR
ncbi:MAG: hypothetical protein ACTSVI_17025 [Promethearchaeota archaeon]